MLLFLAKPQGIQYSKILIHWLSHCKMCGYGIVIAGTLGCVFMDNETHESGVTKCTTGEAWSAFS